MKGIGIDFQIENELNGNKSLSATYCLMNGAGVILEIGTIKRLVEDNIDEHKTDICDMLSRHHECAILMDSYDDISNYSINDYKPID